MLEQIILLEQKNKILKKIKSSENLYYCANIQEIDSEIIIRNNDSELARR
jgi:hypothetical protein